MNKKTAPLPLPYQQPVEELFQALRRFDDVQAHLLIRDAFNRFGVEEVCLYMLIPLFRRIDKGYRTGEISLQVERFTTNIMRERLLAMSGTPTTATTGKILIACAPHELHDTGALMFSLFMRRRGWEVVYLGQNVGFDGLDDILEQLHPKLFVLSVSHLANIRYLNEAARITERGTQGQGIFAYAGQVFVSLPMVLANFPGVYLGNDLMSAVAKAEELMKTATPATAEDDMTTFPPEVYACLQYIDEQRGILEGAAATILTQIVDGRVETARLAQEFIDVLTVAVQFNAPEALTFLAQPENTTLLSYGMDINLLDHFVSEMERYVMNETLPKVAPVLARFIHYLAPTE